MLHAMGVDVLRVICTQLRPANLILRVGDGSRHNEKIVNILNSAFQCNYYYAKLSFVCHHPLLCAILIFNIYYLSSLWYNYLQHATDIFEVLYLFINYFTHRHCVIFYVQYAVVINIL